MFCAKCFFAASFQRHDDRLRVIAEVFAEQVDASFMLGVRFDADIQLYGCAVVDVQVVEADFVGNEHVVHEHAVFIDGDLLQQPMATRFS